MNRKIFNVVLIVILLFGALFTLTGCNFSNQNDDIYGHSFVTNDEYKSLLELKKDGSFKYYKNKDNLTDNYYEGTYKVYRGEKAIEYIDSELSQYGLTRQEQEDLINNNREYREDNYYCLVLKNKKCIVGGKNTLPDEVETPYYGFYLNNSIGLVNMKTANIYEFVRQD